MTYTQYYLQYKHGIKVSGRTVRRWIAAGLIEGFFLGHTSKVLRFTTCAAVDAAVQAGRIPPPRGNPNWRKQEDGSDKEDKTYD